MPPVPTRAKGPRRRYEDAPLSLSGSAFAMRLVQDNPAGLHLHFHGLQMCLKHFAANFAQRNRQTTCIAHDRPLGAGDRIVLSRGTRPILSLGTCRPMGTCVPSEHAIQRAEADRVGQQQHQASTPLLDDATRSLHHHQKANYHA